MRIIGEKLSNQEMLSVKGGAITCQCGWENSPVGEEFTFETNNIITAIQLAGAWCEDVANGAAHCSGDQPE